MATNRVSGHTHAGHSTKQLRRKASELHQNLHALGRLGRKVAREKAGAVQGQAAEYVAGGIDKLDEVQGTIACHISENPFRSTLIAAGVGWVIGRLFMRR